MAITVQPIPAFDDNYIWCISDKGNAWVVDPGCSQSVINYLHQHQLTLCGVLITHHHHDHTGGIQALAATHIGIPIVGPKSDKISGLTRTLSEGDNLVLDGLKCELSVIELPGHTLDHIGYFNDLLLFCGDTLFSGGCGRLFEGKPQQLHDSLQRLANLPVETKVYCTHEYTCANLSFAVKVEPMNRTLLQYQQQCVQQREQHIPTLPSTIGMEKAINPFLRCDQIGVRNSLEQYSQCSFTDNVSRFAALRRWKDNA